MFGAFFFVLLLHAVPAFSRILQPPKYFVEECLNYTVYPVEYNIRIRPYEYNNRFYYDGDVSITVIANYRTNVIEMEAKEMEIIHESVRVYSGSQDLVNRPRPFSHDAKRGNLSIFLAEPLIKYDGHRQYVIKLSFRKEVKFDGDGVFLVKYNDVNGELRYLIQTRLSPKNAVYFFPCFNDPRFYSKFVFTVDTPWGQHQNKYDTSLFVAEEEKRKLKTADTLQIDFKRSPQIYLYEVGFHYSDFPKVETSHTYTGDSIIVWAPAPQIEYCQYTLQFAESVLEMIGIYAKVQKPLTEGPINIVAIPKELNGYEIGSWNLLTNNAIKIVNNPSYMSARQLEQMHFELVQQLARIWLSNPGEKERTKWREEWFREGVATYLAYYFLSQYHFGDNIDVNYATQYYRMQMKQLAMARDWHKSTPTLRSFDGDLAVNIDEYHRQLIAMKTASLLWMLENYVGSDKFHNALLKYLNNHRGQVGPSLKTFMSSFDLDTLECFAGHNESRGSVVLESWLKHPGYPVVSVNVLRDRTPNVVLLKQKRFSFMDISLSPVYVIPISYIIQNTTDCYNCHKPWFTIDAQEYSFRENLNGGWIILLNKNASGYYRVNYDSYTWTLIAKALKENIYSIEETNRAQIANDVFALYVAGYLDQAKAMEVLDFLDLESSLIVWDAVASGFDMLKIDNAKCGMNNITYNEWKNFLRRKVYKIYNASYKNSLSHESRLRKSSIIELACALGNEKCQKHAKGLFQNWSSNISIDPDLRQTCFRYGYKRTLDLRTHNAYEEDDRKRAIDFVNKENHFLYKIPLGEPPSQSYTDGRTTPPPPPSKIVAIKNEPGHGVQHTAVWLLVTINVLIIALNTLTFS